MSVAAPGPPTRCRCRGQAGAWDREALEHGRGAMTTGRPAAPIRVGLIGASPDRGWALSAHLPALNRDPDFEIVGVATSREETARRALDIYGARYCFTDADALARHPEIDLVVVAVKVPLHRRMVSAALAAGKDVLCEWPLGNGAAEAEHLLALAEKAGVRHVIGLQARASAGVELVRGLLRDGYVGEVLSTSVVASGFGWGAVIDPDQTYLFDAGSGADMLTVTGGHLLDAMRFCLGDIDSVSATTATRRGPVVVLPADEVNRFRRFETLLPPEPARTHPRSVPDQIALSGVLAGGAVYSVHLRGGLARSTNFLWEINGTEGDLQITADAGTIQINPLHVAGARGTEARLAPQALPAVAEEPAGPARNIARLYRQIARQRATGEPVCPDFSTAVRLHRTLELIERAAASGAQEARL
jgi:predicted dehydrogenase